MGEKSIAGAIQQHRDTRATDAAKMSGPMADNSACASL